jgi:hypothetical protein
LEGGGGLAVGGADATIVLKEGIRPVDYTFSVNKKNFKK